MKTPLLQLMIFVIILLCFSILMYSCDGTKKQNEQFFTDSGDIGDCKLEGYMTYDPVKGIYALTGAGANMWGEKDAFHFVWKEIDGDFSLSSTIAFEGEGVNTHRKIGIQIRESLDANSRYADIAVHGDGLTSLQYRMTKGGATEELVSGNRAPNQVQLKRQGDHIIMKTGTNIIPDKSDGEIEIKLPSRCYVGIYICSHENNILETAYFSNVEFN
ncbi:MAG: hypothetical protein ACK5KL_12370 [Dysgonomonas sp.]